MRRIARAHVQMIHDAEDNISDHSFRVAVIGMVLAKQEGCDENKVVKMCLFHDMAEIRIGDANFLVKQYVKQDEEGARKDQMEGLPIGDEILQLLNEYERRESAESKTAKDADLLDQMILQREYFYKDPQNHEIWQNHTQKSLFTESAKKLAAQIRTTNPIEWLYSAAEHKTGKPVKR